MTENRLFCLVDHNRDIDDDKGREMYSDNPHLEMLAKMVAEEIHYEATWEWPGICDSGEYMMVMPPDYKDQMYAWAEEYDLLLREW